MLTERSGEALTWLRSRVGVGLTEVGQLGGHSYARTYRPSEGLAGATMMVVLGKLVEKGINPQPPTRSGASPWHSSTNNVSFFWRGLD